MIELLKNEHHKQSLDQLQSMSEHWLVKFALVTEAVGRRRVDVVDLQEVRFRNEGIIILSGGDFE